MSIKRAIERIVARLRNGETCLVHCFGGSGRTGMLVVGVLRAMGCRRPIDEARKVKTVYLDTEKQAREIQDISFSMDEQLPWTDPLLAVVLAAEHIHLLCNSSKIDIKSCHPDRGALKLCHRKVLQTRQNVDDDFFAAVTSVALERTWKRIAGRDRDSQMIVDFVQALHQFLNDAGKSSSYIAVPDLKSVLEFTRLSSGPDRIDCDTFMDLMWLTACDTVNLAGRSRRAMREAILDE